LLSACGLIVAPATASCAYSIEWNGVDYAAGNFKRTVAFGASLGKAFVPACEDEGTAGCQHESAEEVPIFRLPGVDPHVAVGGPSPGGHEVFLAAGFFPQLPGHPLHAAAYGAARRPNERAGWHCGDAIPGLVGTVTHTPGWGWIFGVRFQGDRVRRQNDRTAVFVDARTSITGFDEFGLPRITEGNRLRATVRECTASGQRYKVVADSISKLGA
jgi:Family of unknown function (DUF6281)